LTDILFDFSPKGMPITILLNKGDLLGYGVLIHTILER
jgi:hypothetical protein